MIMGTGGEGAGPPVSRKARKASGDSDAIDDAVTPEVSGIE
jgi:hypothetical protein